MRITYANVMASIALVLVMGGTAYAAVRINSVNVKNSSLTASDVKGGALGVADLSAAAKRSLVGPQGDPGRKGSTGSRGSVGADGSPGDRGLAAYMTSAFAYWDTGLVTYRSVSLPNNNGGGAGRDWDDPMYADLLGGVPQIRAAGQYEEVAVTGTPTLVAALTGQGAASGNAVKSPDSTVKVTFTEGHMNVNASLTFLHRYSGENFTTNSGGTRLHGRIRCGIEIADTSNGVWMPYGVPAWASSGEVSGAPSGTIIRDHELVNVAINGTYSGLTAGAIYNLRVTCMDVDYTGSTQWHLVQSNLTALASK